MPGRLITQIRRAVAVPHFFLERGTDMPRRAAKPLGHNSDEDLSPTERRGLFMLHYNECLAAREKVEAARAEEKAKRKRAKAHGFILKDIDFGMRVATIEDDDIIVQELIRQNEIARWFGLPVGEQADFDFNREPVIDRAKREGAAAAWRGAERDPAPHVPESKAGTAWLKAYDETKKVAAEALAQALEKADRKLTEDADEDTEGLSPDYHSEQTH